MCKDMQRVSFHCGDACTTLLKPVPRFFHSYGSLSLFVSSDVRLFVRFRFITLVGPLLGA